MKNALVVTIILLASCSLWAIDDGQVEYLGGTVPALEVNAIGKLDLTSEAVMQFNSTKGTFSIPYANIDSFEYAQELTHHLGVLPTIAVGLTRTRKHRHYFRIVYHNDNNVSQIVVIEVPKHMPPVLRTVLKARAPHATSVMPNGGGSMAGVKFDNCNCRIPGPTAGGI
jgi:hypothetical protein